MIDHHATAIFSKYTNISSQFQPLLFCVKLLVHKPGLDDVHIISSFELHFDICNTTVYVISLRYTLNRFLVSNKYDSISFHFPLFCGENLQIICACICVCVCVHVRLCVYTYACVCVHVCLFLEFYFSTFSPH